MSQPLPRALLLISEGNSQNQVLLSSSPFTIGRLNDRDLVFPYPYISRNHAHILLEDDRFVLIDQGSQSGTFVNGRKSAHHVLDDGDVIHFGSQQGPTLQFRFSESTTQHTLHTLLGNIRHTATPGESGLGKLAWFVEAARRLNNLNAVQEILTALIDTTLQLTGVERGYVFLCDGPGMVLAAGRNEHSEPLEDDDTLSRSAIEQAIGSASDYIVSDGLSANPRTPSHSMLAQNLRTVICIPLRRPTRSAELPGEILGVLYLDSQQRHHALTRTDSDLLTTIATEAAVLVENAMLAQAEESGRRYREELKIAAEIQQGLMMVRIPELPYAQVRAQSVPCTGIGGDFYDVLSLEDGLYVVVADVSGKGVSAAILGSTLQGMIHAQILAGQPLTQIALVANRFICNKGISKYATLVLLHVNREGHAEYLNCGHVQPLLHAGEAVTTLVNSNVPVGLIEDAVYTSDYLKLDAGDRILIVTDGVTEAENDVGESYGDDRLQTLIMRGAAINEVFEQVTRFTHGASLADDCTLLEVCYAACVG